MAKRTRADARTIRTKAALRNALAQAIAEKDSASQITVAEIARRAGIHRKTFYLHYASIEALYDDFALSILQKLARIYRDREAADGEGGARELNHDRGARAGNRAGGGIDFRRLTEAFSLMTEQDPALHQRLFRLPGYRFLHDRIRAVGLEHLAPLMGLNEPIDAEGRIVASMVSAGVLAAWDAWYDSGQTVPAARLAELISATLNVDGAFPGPHA